MRNVKQFAVYLLLVVVFLGVLGLPALVAQLGEWITSWKWPARFIEALERFGEKHGVEL